MPSALRVRPLLCHWQNCHWQTSCCAELCENQACRSFCLLDVSGSRQNLICNHITPAHCTSLKANYGYNFLGTKADKHYSPYVSMKWTKSTLWKGSPEFGLKTISDQMSLAQKQNWKVLSNARSKGWPCSFNDEFFLGKAIGWVLKTQIPDEVVRLSKMRCHSHAPLGFVSRLSTMEFITTWWLTKDFLKNHP